MRKICFLYSAAATILAMSSLAVAPAAAQTGAQRDTDQIEARLLAAERMRATPAELIIGLNLTDEEQEIFGTISNLMMHSYKTA